MKKIKGLRYIENYISESMEQLLLNAVEGEEWLTSLKRRVQHYGYKYDYKARAIDSSHYLGDLPLWSNEILAMLGMEDFINRPFDQLIVNEYLPGQGISAHIDCVPCFDGVIVSLSLGSQAEMLFIGPNGKSESVLLKPRSLFVLQEDARYKWKHCIPNRKSDLINGIRVPRERRISLTFRKIIH